MDRIWWRDADERSELTAATVRCEALRVSKEMVELPLSRFGLGLGELTVVAISCSQGLSSLRIEA